MLISRSHGHEKSRTIPSTGPPSCRFSRYGLPGHRLQRGCGLPGTDPYTHRRSPSVVPQVVGDRRYLVTDSPDRRPHIERGFIPDGPLPCRDHGDECAEDVVVHGLFFQFSTGRKQDSLDGIDVVDALDAVDKWPANYGDPTGRRRDARMSSDALWPQREVEHQAITRCPYPADTGESPLDD